MIARTQIIELIGAVVVVLLQVIVAPHIALLSCVPNFIVAFAMVLSVMRRRAYGCVLPFVLGLLFDFMSGGPVGVMAFSLTLVSMFASRAFLVLDNDTLFMPVIILAAGLLATELCYALFLLALGYNAGFMELFVYGVLPTFAYDLVVGIILYLIAARLLAVEEPTHHDVVQLR